MNEEAASQINPRWSTRRVILATIIIAAVILGFVLFYRFRLVVFSLFEAVVFSTAIVPVVDWLENRGLPRAVSIVVVYLAVLLILVGFIFLAVPLILDQASVVITTLASYYQGLHDLMLSSHNVLINRLAIRLPYAIYPLPSSGTTSGSSFDAVGTALRYGGTIASVLFSITSLLLLTFYWTLEKEKTVLTVLHLVPRDQRDNAREILAKTEFRVGAYIRGLAFLSLAVGTMALAAYLIIGLPHALLLGVLAGVLEVVPLVGPILGAVPAVVVALSQDPSKVLWVILAVVVIQLSENHLLVPRVMDKAVGVNPVVSLLAFAAFSALFGFAGALLAIPMAVLIQILIDRYFLNNVPVQQSEPKGRDQFSLLRYQAQELVQDVRNRVRHKDEGVTEKSDDVEDAIEVIVNELDTILADFESNGADGRK